ncbi:hypothetical protein Tco_0666523 [Tanacetum coccineum]
MAAVEVPQTLEYRGGQLNASPVLEVENFTNWKKRFMCHIIDERKATNLDQRLKSLIMSVLPNDQMNSVINCLTVKSTWDDLILYHEVPSDVKESRVMDLKLCYNTFKFKEVTKEVANFCQSLRNTNHVEDSELDPLFSKLKYKENLIDSIYETKKSKSLVSATPLSTAFFSTSIVQDFQDSPDDEEDTRSSHEYLNDLEEEYQARVLLPKSKSSSALAPSPSSSKNKGLIPETYDWDDEEVLSTENEVTKVKAIMALTNEERVSVGKESARNGDWTKSSMEKHVNTEILKENQNLKFKLKELISITETWLNSSNIVNQYNSDMPITISNIHKSSETEDCTLPNQDTDEVPSNESQRNTTNPSVVFSDSSATDYDSADESSVCSTPLLPLKKLDGVEPISGPRTIKSILKSKSTFKAETLKGIIINEPSSALARGKSSSASKTNSALTGKLKNVKMEDDPPLTIVMKELNELKLQFNKKESSYYRNKNAQQCKRTNHRTCDHADFIFSMNANQHHNGQGESSSRSRLSRPSVSFPSCIHRGYNDHHSNDCLYYPTCEICRSYGHDTHGYNRIISLRRGINPRNLQHVTKNCETCGSNVHTTSDHNDIEWFRKRETLQAKNAESFKASKNESSSTLRSKTPTKRFQKHGPDLNIKAVNEFQYRGLDLKEYSDYAGCNMDRKSTLDAYHALKGVIELHFIPTKYQLADIFTKPMDEPTFKRLIVELGAHYLAHSGEYVAPPSIDVVRQWFPTNRYGEEVSAKGTLKKSLLPPRWRLLMAQIIQCLGGKTGGFDRITNKDATILYSLANDINIDYANIFWEDIILKLKKKQRKKVFSVNNEALKPNQPPPFTDHLLAICTTDKPVVFKAPKPSSIAERVPQGTNPGAQPGHKKQSTSLKQLSVSNKEVTKGGSSKVPTGSKTGHSKKRKESSSAMDSNLSQPLISTTVNPRMHKEDQQATGSPTSLGVTNEARANPQLSSDVSAFNLNVPIYLASFIIHYESASGNDALAVSTAKADPKNYAPSDFVPQQHGINERTKNTSFDHLFAGADPLVLAEQTKSVSEGLDTILTQPLTGKGASSIARQVKEEETSRTIKLEDLAKLVSNVQPSFKDLDSPKEDPVIIVESDAEEDDGIHATENVETKDTSVLKSSSPKSSLIQELTNQLLVKSLKTEFSNIISAHDFNSSLPTKLKNLSSKFNKLTEEVKELKNQVHNLEIKLPCDFKEIPTKLELYKDCHQSLVIRHKSFEQVCSSIRLCILKTGDQSVLSAGQDDTMPAEGEKNTNQATISQLFQRKAEIGEHIKEDKGKKALSSEEAEKESTKSGSDDETTHIPGSMVESSKKKELKKFNFVTESGEHVHLTKEHISTQKKIEEEVKAEATRHEGEIRKEELIDLLGLEVVNKYYNNKLQYDKYCDKMLNRRAASRITNYDVLIRKGPITLKVYREDGTSEIISNFKASDLHLGKWREVMEACPKRTGKG